MIKKAIVELAYIAAFLGAVWLLVTVVATHHPIDEAKAKDVPPTKQEEAAPTPAPPTPPAPDELAQIVMSDTSLKPYAGIISKSGDNRPYWVLTGRIRNKTGIDIRKTIHHVRIEVFIYDPLATASLKDTVHIDVDTEIDPAETASFSRVIQFEPPEGNWTWWADITKVIAE